MADRKLFEYVGRKFSLVIAAASREAADAKITEIKSGGLWVNYADEFGFEELDTDDIFDIRAPKSDDLEDEAHLIV